MGHASIADTDYYLRLTAESYPHIIARVQRAFGDIVPPLRQGRAMATDFAVLLHRFLTSHLAGLRGCSPNTIASYRDTFKLLIAWFGDADPSRPTNSPSTTSTLTRSPRSSTGWRLNGTTASRPATSGWPRSARSSGGCNPRTRPGWPAARTSSPSPPRSKAQPAVDHLTARRPALCSPQPDRSTRRGRRDATLLATLYDTAARVPNSPA